MIPIDCKRLAEVSRHAARYERLLVERGHAKHRHENLPGERLALKDLGREEIVRTRELTVQQSRISPDTRRDVGEILGRLVLRANSILTQAAQVLRTPAYRHHGGSTFEATCFETGQSIDRRSVPPNRPGGGLGAGHQPGDRTVQEARGGSADVRGAPRLLGCNVQDPAGRGGAAETPGAQSATQSIDPVERLLTCLARGEMSAEELRSALRIKHRPTLRSNYLHAALAAGWIEYTLPHKSAADCIWDRMPNLAEHLANVGGAPRKAVESYNAAAASYESRILPSARKFRVLGAGGKKEIEELEAIDQIPRVVNSPDTAEGSDKS